MLVRLTSMDSRRGTYTFMNISVELNPPTSAEVDQHLWMRLFIYSMEVNLRLFNSTEVAMGVALLSRFVYFQEGFHQLL